MIKRTGSVAEVRQQVKEWKKQGLTVGLVPTVCSERGFGKLPERY